MKKDWRKEYSLGDGLWVAENKFPYLLDLSDQSCKIISSKLRFTCRLILEKPRYGDVTRDDFQRRFLAQHRVATQEQCCNDVLR